MTTDKSFCVFLFSFRGIKSKIIKTSKKKRGHVFFIESNQRRANSLSLAIGQTRSLIDFRVSFYRLYVAFPSKKTCVSTVVFLV